jgi:hypothetical protein
MPLFGYSEDDLQQAYERGRREGRSSLAVTLQDRIYITYRRKRIYDSVPHTPEGMVDFVDQTIADWIDVRRHRDIQQEVMDRLREQYCTLENRMTQVLASTSHSALIALEMERDDLKREVGNLREEVRRMKEAHTAEMGKLRQEIDELDRLIVEYEGGAAGVSADGTGRAARAGSHRRS